jgi:hypothetical protein
MHRESRQRAVIHLAARRARFVVAQSLSACFVHFVYRGVFERVRLKSLCSGLTPIVEVHV